MTDNVNQDTENAIKLLLKICEVIMHRFEIKSGDRALTNGETMDSFDESLVETSGILFRFIEDFENTFGGGYTDMGVSKSLREISEGNVTDFNLKGLFRNYQTLINKLVLLDSHRQGQSDLNKAQEIYASFSEQKRRAA